MGHCYLEEFGKPSQILPFTFPDHLSSLTYPVTWSFHYSAPNILNNPVLLLRACLQLLHATIGVYWFFFFVGINDIYLISQLLWKKMLVEILLYHCAFLTLEVWLVVGCVATASHLSRCGLQLKLSLLWAPWCLVVSHLEVCLLSKHRLQEGAVGSSPLLMEEPTYPGELPLGQEGLPWVEDRLCHQHPLGANFHSPTGGKGLLKASVIINILGCWGMSF